MEQSDLLRLTVETLDRLRITYAIVGSFASGAWGESRFTQDIDVLVEVDEDSVVLLCRAFPQPEFYVSESAAREAVRLRRQFNVIHPDSGNKIDFMIPGESIWSARQLQRRRAVPLFDDLTANFAAPEDVILGKLLYYREGGSNKHLRDIAGILKITENVDRQYVDKYAEELGVTELWRACVERVESDGRDE